jgi:hypothetical protein
VKLALAYVGCCALTLALLGGCVALLVYADVTRDP